MKLNERSAPPPRVVPIVFGAALLSALSFSVFFQQPRDVRAAAPAAPSTADLRADKLKVLYRREPRAQDLVPKIEARLEESEADDPLVRRTREQLEQIIMSASNVTEDRLSDLVDLLERMAGSKDKPPEADLRQLQERYAKLAARLDDQILVRDFESVLPLHDRFVRHTSLGLWDKAEIEKQLSRMEELVEIAPEITYGRSELLRSLRDKKLEPPAKGCYVGVSERPEMFLSAERPSVSVLADSTGGSLSFDAADLTIQNPDGSLVDLDHANRTSLGVPFSPPLSLWMKARWLEGRIPVITFRLPGAAADRPYSHRPETQKSGATPIYAVQDVLDGKLDDYLTRNLKTMAATRAAGMVGLFSEFDRLAAATAFGADGRTPYYLLVDPKLAALPEDKRQAELRKKLSKGALTKDIGDELSKHYGDPKVPDGPERVRDAWKRFRSLAQEAGASSLSLFSTCGSFHGNKKALSLAGLEGSGAQDWNKLAHYWPGEDVLDWLGAEATGSSASKQAVPQESLDQFVQELRASSWGTTPLLLSEIAPDQERRPAAEESWLALTFVQAIPQLYPEVKLALVDYPQRLTIWAPGAHSAFRKYVSSSPYFKQKLNLKALPASASKGTWPSRVAG